MRRVAVVALFVLVGCSGVERMQGSMLDAMSRRPPLDGEGVVALPSENPVRYHLRYRDGQVSLNDACVIRLENKLNPKIPPFYVNGQPIGFC